MNSIVQAGVMPFKHANNFCGIIPVVESMEPSDVIRVQETIQPGDATHASGGRLLLKIISVGEGSSGIWTTETLQAAIQDRVFPIGTQCYIDHATALKRGPHGERSIRDLVAVLDSEAFFDSSEQAIFAEAKIFGVEASRIKEIAPHIGVSISGNASTLPMQKGAKKPTIDRILAIESVDFVNKAGRGGAIQEILESQVAESLDSTRSMQLSRLIQDQIHDPENEMWAGLKDFDDKLKLVYYYLGDKIFQQSYKVSGDDQKVTLKDDPIEVQALVSYVPLQTVRESTEQKEANMPEIPQERLDALLEAERQVSTLEAKLKTANEEIQRYTVEESQRTAVAKATKIVESALTGVHPQLAARVKTLALAQVTEGQIPEGYDQLVSGLLEAEKSYLAAFGPQQNIVGFGESAESTSIQHKRTTNAFGRKIKEV